MEQGAPALDRASRLTVAAYVVVLAAGMGLWLAAPDIKVTETSGNGCGRWNGAELAQHREQLLLYFMAPLAVAQAIAWRALARREVGSVLVASSLAGAAWLLAVLWQPANIYIVYSQLLGWMVVPALTAAFFIAVSRHIARQTGHPRFPARVATNAAFVPPALFIVLFLATRIPWVWTC